MQGNNPLQGVEAKMLIDRARLALEHALPRGTLYCCLIQAPGLNTIASNMEKRDQLAMMKEASGETKLDLGFRPPR